MITPLPVKEHPDIWYHIDAAWAGVALACPEYRDSLYLPEINEYATSFCTNFHKVLHAPIPPPHLTDPLAFAYL